MKYLHPQTGLVFSRNRGASNIRVTGNTYTHRQALASAGFVWDGDLKRYEGTAESLTQLSVPESFRIFSGLSIMSTSKIGGGLKIKSL